MRKVEVSRGAVLFGAGRLRLLWWSRKGSTGIPGMVGRATLLAFDGPDFGVDEIGQRAVRSEGPQIF
jgi:hypothetical protein